MAAQPIPFSEPESKVPFSPKQLAERTLQRRAVEAAIWGMPFVSVDAMRQAFFRAGAKYGDILYFSQPADWKFQTTTPNASSLYVYFNFNTKDTPFVVDFPEPVGAGLFGSLMDAWEVPLTDVGPEGEDKGKGGKYLLLPPGYKGNAPTGFFPIQMSTYNGYALFRSIPQTSSAADLEQAIGLVKKMRLYPYTESGKVPASQYIDIAGKLFDGIARMDDTFYDSLAKMVEEEPVQPRDLVAMAQLRSLGIEKGKTFKPDQRTREILKEAVAEAHAEFMHSVTIVEPWWPGKQWGFPVSVGPSTRFTFLNGDRYDVDDRGKMFFLAYAIPKKLGAATFYSGTYVDAKNMPLLGDKTYVLHIPANVPAKQFWAVTVYDLQTAAFIREAPKVEIDSYQETQKNADGSVNVYFGPKAPAGKESNWIYTAPGRQWFTYFRFYGPKKAVLNKTWVLPNIEEASQQALSLKPAPADTFDRSYPTKDTTQRARDDADYEQALIAYRFWYPAVSLEGLFHGMREIGVQDNHSLGLGACTPHWVAFTGNSDTPYAIGALDLRDSPMVVEIPPGPFVSVVDDHNQRWVVDMGLPGPDKGQGGKYLIVPPGYQSKPPAGYRVVPSSTYKNLIAIRTIPQNGDIKAAMEKAKTVNIYPLANPSKLVTYVDVTGKNISSTSVPWEDNIQYWQRLRDIIDYEPVLEEYRPMYGVLMELGIMKGKPFDPDPRIKAILERAARDGKAQMLVASFDSSRQDRITWKDRHWEWVALSADPNFETNSGIDLEARDRWFMQAIAASPAMFSRLPGAGSLYWLAVRDENGDWLDGGKTYKLTIPEPVPHRLFWSVTVYDADTRSQIQTDQEKAALRSMFELKDVSKTQPTELYFGPQAPAGTENVWIKTIPGKGWFTYFRIYGPEGPAFDGSWKPGDFQEIKLR